ncbi:hypothetical protein HAX54_007508 [Datura stramonium]|uniref:BSD domain-containing protein n=1 Tax=Datura stramonium TaxID=4076 RepID=A0ABS8TDB9_DATST|nr:hypothetical protein [Datura stramonium]
MDVYSWFRRSLSRTTRTTTTAQPSPMTTNCSTASLTNYLISSNPFPLTPSGTSLSKRHALLVLSKVKELSQMRFKLCPRHLKEHQFWTIYFALVKGFVTKYELHAIQMDKLKQMRTENENTQDVAACDCSSDEELEPEELENILAKLKEAVKSDVRQVSIWNALGIIILRTGRLQSAISVFSTLLDIFPDKLDCLGNLGIACIQRYKGTFAGAGFRLHSIY